MTTDRWERLKALFHGALEQPLERRSVWLVREAGGDDDLAREAAALVAAHETAGSFLEESAAVDPADIAEADALEPGTRLGDYVIEHEVGRGGMGIVYAARDLRVGRRVALKALTPLLDSNLEQQQRLRREARAAATISHPSVATVFALEEIDGRLFIASEFIEGRTLRAELARGPLVRRRALEVAADIAGALAAAHDAGVVHRDLKPENVLMTPTGTVKVVDFGIAHADSGAMRLTRTGMAIGTPAYMAPEQLLGAADVRADVYALGVVLAEMLAGVHPLTPGRGAADVPASAVAARCMETDPLRRYQSAREALAAIEGEIAGATGGGGLTRSGARWWWEFHQGATAIVYALMTWPAWVARGVVGDGPGNAVFIAVLAPATVTGILRLHLWFVSRFYPGELRWARGRASAWLAAGDWLFVGALVAGGVMVGEGHAVLVLVHLTVGIGAAVAFLLIEPATARAAFGDR